LSVSPCLLLYPFQNEGEEVEETEGDEAMGLKAASRGSAVGLPVKRRRHLTGVNDADELIFSDGSTVGHRDNIRVYKQNVRPEDPDDEIRDLLRAQRALTHGPKGALALAEKKKKWTDEKHYFRSLRKADSNKYNGQYRANNMKFIRDPTAHLM
jgi:hypothetical protein